MRVAILGAGYVGACTAAVLAEQGHSVTIADPEPLRIEAISQGRTPFYEPGLDAALQAASRAGRLRGTSDSAGAVRASELTMLCVGTPSKRNGEQDPKFIKQAARQVGEALRGRDEWHVVVTKSTVLPGTTEGIVGPAVQKASGKAPGAGFGLAHNPEFLKEGDALADARKPDRIVVGAVDEASSKACWALYEGIEAPRVSTDVRTAEMIKYVSNAMLATRVGFANEMANLAEQLGVDIAQVMQGVGLDQRIGPQFLRAGAGFGGSCFPKDLSALLRLGEERRAPSRILRAVLDGNQEQPLHVVRIAREALGSLRGRRIALLGVAFKPGTDDVRETRALPIWQALHRAGARVVCYDPHAGPNFAQLAGRNVELAATVFDALDQAECAVVQTEWPEFKALSPELFKQHMARPLVVDGRRTFDPAAMRAAGVEYRAIGLGR